MHGQLISFVHQPGTEDILSEAIINRGSKNGIRQGHLYAILGGQTRVILCLFEVIRTEKSVCSAKPIWVSESCPALKPGSAVYNLGRFESRIEQTRAISILLGKGRD